MARSYGRRRPRSKKSVQLRHRQEPKALHHARVGTRPMRSGPKFTLVRGRHDAFQLAQEVIAHISRRAEADDLDPGRQFAKWCTQLGVKLHFCDIRRRTTYPSHRFMQRGIKIISNIFFFDALNRCRFKWQPGLLSLERKFGYYEPITFSKSWTLIVLESLDVHHRKGDRDHKTSVLGTLIHECIHAFIGTYVCGDQCRNKACRDAPDRGVGVSGHGPAYIQIATHIEAVLNKRLSADIKIGIERSLEHEYEESGFVPSTTEIAQCHPDSRSRIEAFRLRASQMEDRVAGLFRANRFRAVPYGSLTMARLASIWRGQAFQEKSCPVERLQLVPQI